MLRAPARRATKSPALVVPAFECGCGTVFNAPDGKLPVGWTSCNGTVWCADCTRLGLPTRHVSSGTYPRRRRRAA